ncbi:MAG TPA: hypothetical protein V6D05_13120 [Stenomitos sp.]
MRPILPMVVVGVLAAAGPAAAQLGTDVTSLPGLDKAPPFEADVAITSQTMPKPTAYHISYMGQKIRFDGQGAEGQTFITRMDQGMVYLSQGGNQWMKMSLAAMGGVGLSQGSFRHTMRKVGQATVDGKLCDVYESRSDDGSTSSTNYLYHDVPVRSYVRGPQGATTVEYRNLRIGSVSASLFELPAGAQVTSMEEMMQGLMGNPSLKGLTP